MKIKHYIALLILIVSHTIKAQTVYAQVSSKQVQVGVPFEYAIVINANPNNYTPPSFKDFDIVGGPNQSSSVQWVNGQTSTQMTLSWALVAKKEGKATIGSAVVNCGSQRFETNAIALEVTKGAVTNQQSARITARAPGAKCSNILGGGVQKISANDSGSQKKPVCWQQGIYIPDV